MKNLSITFNLYDYLVFNLLLKSVDADRIKNDVFSNFDVFTKILITIKVIIRFI